LETLNPEVLHHFIISSAGLLGKHVALTFFTFVALNILFAIFLLPCSIFAVAAGAIWGGYGIGIVMFSAMLANLSTFLISKGALRPFALKFISNKHQNYNRYLELAQNHAWTSLILVYANPLLPSASFGYLFGLTGLSVLKFILVSTICTIPMNLLLNFSGAYIVRSNASEAIIFLGCVGLFVCLMYFGRLRKKTS